MIRARKKSIALITALIFMLSIVAPMAAFAAADDYTNFSSTYEFISTGKDKKAGAITVKPKTVAEEPDVASVINATYVVVRAELPDGVEFSNDVTGYDVNRSSYVETTYVGDGSSNNPWFADTFSVDFDYNPIDVDSDFSGDLKVAVTVTGIGANGKITFTDWDDLVIAKVTGADISVTADDPKTVSIGGPRDLAEIEIKESQAGAFKAGENTLRFDIMTKGVKFTDGTYTSLNGFSAVRLDPLELVPETAREEYEDNDRIDITVSPSTGLPGAVTFVPEVRIDPSVTGEIKIRVSSPDNNDVKSTTLVVGEVGEVTGVIEEVEDNDTVVYAGSRGTELDVTFEINTASDGAFFDDGDIVSLTLNNGKFVEGQEPTFTAGSETLDAELYNSDKSVYVTIEGDSVDSIEVSNIYVKCDNDVEEGDIILTAGGNAGVEGEVVVGQFAKPFTVTAETPNILSEALNQAAGDLIITEVDAEALAPFDDVYDDAVEELGDTAVFFELPSGIELKGTPKVDVTEGNIDVDIEVVDDNIIALIIEGDSSDASTIEISGIRYDTGRLALTGPVELEAYFAYYDDAEDEWVTVDGVLCTVANAIVGDQNTVTASFTVGDEGVAIVNGRTLVQVNLLCDVLGLQKSWDAAEKTAYFVKDGKVVAFPMGENAVYINGVKVPMDQGGMIINDFTYATLRGLEAAFGGTLDWDNDTKTATFVFNK